ncbi:MAG: glutamate--tRNA ligase [Alphaproteobacteria bacterium]
MTVTTRFAPSPTGFLHIGGARTAYFNWLFARHHGGRFLLRIEDTDKARSTEAAMQAIVDGLAWLGLAWDGDVIYQSARQDRHAAVAHELVAAGRAYRCYCTPEELEQMRAEAKAAGRSLRYDGRWRDRDPAKAPAGVPPVIRVKAPLAGSTTIDDAVQGEVTVGHDQLDDFVLLRADGTPTYMLSVVVDDHDMGITHVIRGDDHLTNAFRQRVLYEACGWDVPAFAHIPMIHGPDGAKLSKRHGALGVEAYREMGYLPEALRNYLLRLGWSHGDDEVIDTDRAVAWFGLEAVGRSPSRFDFDKLNSLNNHYIRQAEPERLAGLVLPLVAARTGADTAALNPGRLVRLVDELKPRANTLVEMAEQAAFLYAARPLAADAKAARALDEAALARLAALAAALRALPAAGWTPAALEDATKAHAEAAGLKLKDVAQPLRAALTGSLVSPGIFGVLAALGRDESLGRIDDAVAGRMAGLDSHEAVTS